MKLRIIPKVIFSQHICKLANPAENFDLMDTTIFGPTNEMGQILSKLVFLLKMSHIQQNLAFLVF